MMRFPKKAWLDQAVTPGREPRKLNDDDLYIVDIRTLEPVTSYANSSATARDARYNGVAVKPGQALLKGLQLRNMQDARAAVAAVAGSAA